MASYTPTEQDVALWTNGREGGGQTEVKETSLQEAADRRQEQTFAATAADLASRNKDSGTTGTTLDVVSNRDNKLLELTSQMAEAQRTGDSVRIARLEAVLDGLTSGVMDIDANGAGKKPSAQPKAEAPKAAPRVKQEAPQTFEELPAASAVNDAMGGPEATDEVISYVNSQYSEDEARTVLKALQSDNPDDAVIAMSVAKQRMQQAAKGIKGDGQGFNEAKAQELSDRFGAKADVITSLSNKVASGEMSQAAAMAAVAADPVAMATAAEMIKAGVIAFN